MRRLNTASNLSLSTVSDIGVFYRGHNGEAMSLIEQAENVLTLVGRLPDYRDGTIEMQCQKAVTDLCLDVITNERAREAEPHQLVPPRFPG
jgi:hypothetical protein